ncbi:Uncharacterised protein [uncultured archaeon]|nr:Uncharacterised protein [uncultured archaeon]
MFENVGDSRFQFTEGAEYDPTQDVDIWSRIIGSLEEFDLRGSLRGGK